jgi:phosphoribosylaminoimidazole carboxylase PurE protein
MNPVVGIVMGSDSDMPVMTKAVALFERFGVAHETEVMSAHRQPERVREYAASARDRGLKVIIAGAGLAAHLPGVVAAQTTLPVIGVPLESGNLGGLDALLSCVQMPPGVPVATVAIGSSKNAAVLAVQILAAGDPVMQDKLEDLKAALAAGDRL